MQETTRLVAVIWRCAAAFLIAACLLLPSASFAQGTPSDSATPAQETAQDTWGDKTQPKNFVRSKGPAKDGQAYNWVQMGYASIIMVVMIGFMIWLVRRTPKKD